MRIDCKLIESLPTKLAALMGSLLAHARSVSLMYDALKQVGILLRDVLSNDQAVVHSFVIESFEYTEHVLFKIL